MGIPQMRNAAQLLVAAGFLLISDAVFAHLPGLAKPEVLLSQVVSGMPKGDKQEIRVMRAIFNPLDKTVFHTHRFPVTVMVQSGAFTLELEGRPTVVVKAGETYVEPPNVRMTGYNRSETEALNVVIFYVSDPGAPFLDVPEK
jgi:quercetin dioxygenase-like cupin family protein